MNYLSNSVKKLSACALILVGFVTSTFGNFYSGTITQTITSTNDSNFYVGQTFIGCYEYESSSIDGLFGIPDRNHDSAKNTLQGCLINWNPHSTGGIVEETMHTLNSFLTISNGCVTDFGYNGERSYGQYWFSECSFAWDGYFPFQTGISTSGTLSFSAPAMRSVPEGAVNSLSLLALSFFGLQMFRRKSAVK